MPERDAPEPSINLEKAWPTVVIILGVALLCVCAVFIAIGRYPAPNEKPSPIAVKLVKLIETDPTSWERLGPNSDEIRRIKPVVISVSVYSSGHVFAWVDGEDVPEWSGIGRVTASEKVLTDAVHAWEDKYAPTNTPARIAAHQNAVLDAVLAK